MVAIHKGHKGKKGMSGEAIEALASTVIDQGYRLHRDIGAQFR